MLLANLFFAISFFCDLKLYGVIDYDLLIFIEDFAKLTGIFSWLIYIYDTSNKLNISLADLENPGISSLAATSMVMLGFVPPAEYSPSLVEIK